MSKRPEIAAMKAWADYEYRQHPQGLYHTCFVDGYQQGYEQAEKDLDLTAGDIKRISDIIEQMQDEGRDSGFCPPDWWGTEMFYEEALRRYNESKRTD